MRRNHIDRLRNLGITEYAGGISPAHLWFIAFLFLISVALLPLMRRAIANAYAPD